MKKLIGLIALLAATAILVAGCGGTAAAPRKTSSIDKAKRNADSNANQTYNQVNRLDFRNFNARQRITDDPSTITWCTLYPPTQGQEPITYAFAGKVTSSTKHPFPSTVTYVATGDVFDFKYNPEIPSPDGMYGSSDLYEYGLDPSGQTLVQFNTSYICSTAPTTYQANKTTVVSAFDPRLTAISQRASALIKKSLKLKGAAKAQTLAQADRLLRSVSQVSK